MLAGNDVESAGLETEGHSDFLILLPSSYIGTIAIEFILPFSRDYLALVMKRNGWFWLFSLILAGATQASFSMTHAERLDAALREYRVIRRAPDVGLLVAFDQKLTRLVEQIQASDKEGISGKLWKPEYEAIGLYVGHYSDQLGYSGKFLLQAHRLDPQSPLRDRTLFATIVGEGNFSELARMPDIQRAYQYLREFPNGPYAGATYAILGTFYSDLYKVIRTLRKDPIKGRDYKYECFAPYIKDDGLEAQARVARNRAADYLARAIAASPKGPRAPFLHEELEAMRGSAEPTGWSWCTD